MTLTGMHKPVLHLGVNKPITSFGGEYRFLSNFYPCRVTLGDITFPSVEHAYQAAKTNSISQRVFISKLKSPGDAKRIGREIFIVDNWNDIKVRIMTNLVDQKFQYKSLRDKLLETGDVELVEGNHWGDTFWGVCNGKGKNMLGKILMNQREYIRLF